MKEFVKMTLAVIAGLFIFGFVAFFLSFAMIGAVAALGESHHSRNTFLFAAKRHKQLA